MSPNKDVYLGILLKVEVTVTLTMSEEDLITLHENKMTELKQLHMQIPTLTEALAKDPNNVAIQERLKLATDVTSDVTYLSTGPHLIMHYLNATDPMQKQHYRERYYREALKQEPSTQVKAEDSQPLPAKRRRTNTNNKLPVPNAHDLAGNCQSCGGFNTTFYRRRSGDRACHVCGVAVLDNLTNDWNDLSYDERMGMNLDQNTVFDRSRERLIRQANDSDGNLEIDDCQNLSEEDRNTSAGASGNKYKYECRSYMLERLLSVQCLEHAKISQQDFEKIYATLHKHRIYDVTGWTATEMRDFLKICKLPKLYKHVNYLLAYMSAKMPLRIDQEVQNLFIEAFDKVEIHMNKYKSMLSDSRMPERKSRPHYGYICRQIAKILGQDDLIQHFPNLVSPEKILLYDAFWAKLCEDVGFPFYPSPR